MAMWSSMRNYYAFAIATMLTHRDNFCSSFWLCLLIVWSSTLGVVNSRTVFPKRKPSFRIVTYVTTWRTSRFSSNKFFQTAANNLIYHRSKNWKGPSKRKFFAQPSLPNFRAIYLFAGTKTHVNDRVTSDDEDEVSAKQVAADKVLSRKEEFVTNVALQVDPLVEASSTWSAEQYKQANKGVAREIKTALNSPEAFSSLKKAALTFRSGNSSVAEFMHRSAAVFEEGIKDPEDFNSASSLFAALIAILPDIEKRQSLIVFCRGISEKHRVLSGAIQLPDVPLKIQKHMTDVEDKLVNLRSITKTALGVAMDRSDFIAHIRRHKKFAPKYKRARSYLTKLSDEKLVEIYASTMASAGWDAAPFTAIVKLLRDANETKALKNTNYESIVHEVNLERSGSEIYEAGIPEVGEKTIAVDVDNNNVLESDSRNKDYRKLCIAISQTLDVTETMDVISRLTEVFPKTPIFDPYEREDPHADDEHSFGTTESDRRAKLVDFLEHHAECLPPGVTTEAFKCADMATLEKIVDGIILNETFGKAKHLQSGNRGDTVASYDPSYETYTRVYFEKYPDVLKNFLTRLSNEQEGRIVRKLHALQDYISRPVWSLSVKELEGQAPILKYEELVTVLERLQQRWPNIVRVAFNRMRKLTYNLSIPEMRKDGIIMEAFSKNELAIMLDIFLYEYKQSIDEGSSFTNVSLSTNASLPLLERTDGASEDSAFTGAKITTIDEDDYHAFSSISEENMRIAPVSKDAKFENVAKLSRYDLLEILAKLKFALLDFDISRDALDASSSEKLQDLVSLGVARMENNTFIPSHLGIDGTEVRQGLCREGCLTFIMDPDNRSYWPDYLDERSIEAKTDTDLLETYTTIFNKIRGDCVEVGNNNLDSSLPPVKLSTEYADPNKFPGLPLDLKTLPPNQLRSQLRDLHEEIPGLVMAGESVDKMPLFDLQKRIERGHEILSKRGRNKARVLTRAEIIEILRENVPLMDLARIPKDHQKSLYTMNVNNLSLTFEKVLDIARSNGIDFSTTQMNFVSVKHSDASSQNAKQVFESPPVNDTAVNAEEIAKNWGVELNGDSDDRLYTFDPLAVFNSTHFGKWVPAHNTTIDATLVSNGTKVFTTMVGMSVTNSSEEYQNLRYRNGESIRMIDTYHLEQSDSPQKATDHLVISDSVSANAGMTSNIRTSGHSTLNFAGGSSVKDIASAIAQKTAGAPDLKRHSAVDDIHKQFEPSTDLIEFKNLGLSQGTLAGLSEVIGHDSVPTPVQSVVIYEILRGNNTVFAAETGSGKTLAYLLPIIENLKAEEARSTVIRLPRRPRAMVLLPTRDLADQVYAVVKKLSHFSKVASAEAIGGVDISRQKRSLQYPVDIVVGTVGRMLLLREKGYLALGDVRYIVVDEVDNMLLQGFGSDVRQLIRPILSNNRLHTHANPYSSKLYSVSLNPQPPQIIMATATLSAALKRILHEQYFPPVNYIEVPGIHKAVPNVKHQMLQTKGRDRIKMLMEILKVKLPATPKTMIFCNTVKSCQSVEYAIKDANFTSVNYHADVPEATRAEYLKQFRDGEVSTLVCTDLASRGLDLPKVDRILNFDFPLSPIDYIHRAGRTGRMRRSGAVLSLVTKQDLTLAIAIERSIDLDLSFDKTTRNKSEYEQGGRLRYLTQAGGHGVKVRNLGLPKRKNKSRRAGWKPPRSIEWHRARAALLKDRMRLKTEKTGKEHQKMVKQQQGAATVTRASMACNLRGRR